jgi:ketosteroid isomerase-like protein
LSAPDDEALARVLDRQAINDCLVRYTRGVDRHDTELILSAYHEDALDSHGYFEGTPPELAAWGNEQHAKRWAAHQHYITNTSIEFDGDVAHTETYALVVQRRADGTGADMLGARYIDRFEKRAGEWRIARRVTMLDWIGETVATGERPHRLLELYPNGTWDGDDLSYARPLPGPREGPPLPAP